MSDLQLDHIGALTFAVVFLSGVLTSFTPCVYPMFPIVIGYLGSAKGSRIARLKTAAAYSLGLALVYSALGMAAALSGRMLGDMTTNPWLNLVFGIFILVLAGSMMDFYHIPLPGIWKGTTPRGAFLVGMTSGLVASPCTAPVLASLLFYVARERAVITGGALLFTFALGLNTVLLAIGFSTSLLSKLPRSGVWMARVKHVLALVMMGGGIYFIFKAGTFA